MKPVSYARHRFPPEVIRHAVWLYLRFTLSYRDVEELLAERGLAISYETIRRWVMKFGPAFARNLRRRRPRPSDQWHMDEMVVSIQGRRMYLWRAVDHEGEVLDLLVEPRRDKAAGRLKSPSLGLIASPPTQCDNAHRPHPSPCGRLRRSSPHTTPVPRRCAISHAGKPSSARISSLS